MVLEQLRSRFLNLSATSGLKFSLGAPASESEIAAVEQRLGLVMPTQIRSFYLHYNGLKVDDPRVDVFRIEHLVFSLPNRLEFALLGDSHLYFDVSGINEANQWDIVTTDGRRVTLTLASFWSNRMWSWIEKRRPICQDEVAT